MSEENNLFLEKIAEIFGLDLEEDPDHVKAIKEVKKAMKTYLKIEDF